MGTAIVALAVALGAPAAAWTATASAATAPAATAAPAAAPVSAITAVSCAGKTCIGLSALPTGGIDGTSQFLRIWNGTTWKASWTMSAGSNGAGAGSLSDVSCRSAASCVAVGETYNGLITSFLQNKTIKPVALAWNGRGWTKVAPPVPAGGHGTLFGVDCWAVKHCAVVGAYHPSNGLPTETAYGDFWNGAKWTAVKVPAGGRIPTPDAVSCLSGSSCLAVGESVVSGAGLSAVKRSFADVWHGKGWKAVAVGVPKGGTGTTGGLPNGNVLYAVGCASAADCVALGFAGPPFERVTPTNFAEAFNGKRLSVVADS